MKQQTLFVVGLVSNLVLGGAALDIHEDHRRALERKDQDLKEPLTAQEDHSIRNLIKRGVLKTQPSSQGQSIRRKLGKSSKATGHGTNQKNKGVRHGKPYQGQINTHQTQTRQRQHSNQQTQRQRNEPLDTTRDGHTNDDWSDDFFDFTDDEINR